MLSAAASLGMILLWDVDGGLTQIDKYLYSSEDYIKVDIGLESTGNICVTEFILPSDTDMIVISQSFYGVPFKNHFHQFNIVTLV